MWSDWVYIQYKGVNYSVSYLKWNHYPRLKMHFPDRVYQLIGPANVQAFLPYIYEVITEDKPYFIVVFHLIEAHPNIWHVLYLFCLEVHIHFQGGHMALRVILCMGLKKHPPYLSVPL